MYGKFVVKAYAVTCIGKYRDNHEDNFLLDDGQMLHETEQREISAGSGPMPGNRTGVFGPRCGSNMIFAVADGMGGHNAGETASRIAVEELSKMKDYIFRTNDPGEINQRFQEYVVKANNIISLKGRVNADLKGMGTTLAGIILTDRGIESFNLGDSRVYGFTPDRLQRLTKDHTEGQRLLDMNIVNHIELNLIESRKAILRYLGIDDRSYVPAADIGELIASDSRAWFLICTDGLTDVVDDNKIHTILDRFLRLNDMKGAAGALLDLAMEGSGGSPGGVDNITIVMVEVDQYKPTLREKLFGKLQING